MYTVKLRGGEMKSLPDKEAISLKNALSGKEAPVYVELDNDLFRSSEVISIVKNPLTQADIVPSDRQIAPVDHRGEYSPAKEKLRKRFARG